MLIIFIILIIILVIFNHTYIFHPKIRKNILVQKYTSTEDLWFTKEGNQNLIIFLHGMFSTPSTFETIAPLLVEKGYDIYVPTLPASALTKKELQNIGPWTWKESLLVINHKLDSLPSHYNKRILGGHSQGGSFALNIATERKFDALIIIASPLDLYGNHMSLYNNIAIYLSGILCFLSPKGIHTPVLHTEERKKLEKKCDAEGLIFPLTIYTFKKGLAKLRKKLHKITIPLFLSYCKEDTFVHFKNKDYIRNQISSTKITEKIFSIPKEIEPYGQKHQLLNYNLTRDELTKAIFNFLDSI